MYTHKIINKSFFFFFKVSGGGTQVSEERNITVLEGEISGFFGKSVLSNAVLLQQTQVKGCLLK